MSALEISLLLLGGAVGAMLARMVRLPVWPLTGSILGAGTYHVVLGGANTFPDWWAFTAQVLIGAAVGAAVVPRAFRDLSRIALPGAVAVAALIVVGLSCGILTSELWGVDDVTASLGMIPGGVGEMVAAATALGADSALVAGMHVTRVLVVVASLPVLIRVATHFEFPRDSG